MGWASPHCPSSANNAIFGNLVAMQHPHLLHPPTLYQLSGSSIFANSNQSKWIACLPIVPALQIMRDPAASPLSSPWQLCTLELQPVRLDCVPPDCPSSANNAISVFIVAVQHSHRRHPRALHQLPGSPILASSHRSEWGGRPPILPAPQLMRYSAA